MIESLLDRIGDKFGKPVAIVGFKAQMIKDKLGDRCDFVLQEKQLGTGHAIQCAADFLKKSGCERVIVLPGDHPLIGLETVEGLVEAQKRTNAKIVIATVEVPDFEGNFQGFWGFGRILRDEKGAVSGIVELKDATREQQQIRELNTSYYCFDTKWLLENLGKLDSKNAAGEFYLTDMVGIAVGQGEPVEACALKDHVEAMGANTSEQLAIIERKLDGRDRKDSKN